MAAIQCIRSCRQGQKDLSRFKLSLKIRKKGDFERFMVYLFQKLLICIDFSHKVISRVYRDRSEKGKMSSER